MLPESAYNSADLANALREYESIEFFSAEQKLFLAKTESTPLSSILKPGSTFKEVAETLFRVAYYKTNLICVLWVTLFDLIYLLGKYAQPVDRSKFFQKFDSLSSLLTTQKVVQNDPKPWAEQLSFHSPQYAAHPSQKALIENYEKNQDTIDYDIKELIDKKVMPIIFTEIFEYPSAKEKQKLVPHVVTTQLHAQPPIIVNYPVPTQQMMQPVPAGSPLFPPQQVMYPSNMPAQVMYPHQMVI